MTVFDQNGADGLAQVQALLDSGRQPPMNETIGIALVAIERGKAVFEGTPGTSVYNPMGSVHGGYAATLLDSACGIAVHTALPAGQGYATLELKVSYVRAMSAASGRVRAEGALLSLGRRVAFAEARLVDEAGRLCAKLVEAHRGSIFAQNRTDRSGAVFRIVLPQGAASREATPPRAV